MELFLTIVEGDSVAALFLLLFLYFLATKVIERARHLAPWGGRCGLAAWFLYLIVRGFPQSPQNAEEMLGYVLRAFLAAGFVCVITWLLVPVIVFLWTRSFGRAIRFCRSRWAARRRHHIELLSQRLSLDAQRRAEEQRRLEAPALERQRHEAAQQAAIVAEQRAVAQKRREDGRLRCELLYERHAQQLLTYFPRKRFAQLLDRYLHDRVPADEIEQREQWVKEAIRESIGAETSKTPKFQSVAEIAAYFEARRKELEQLPHSEEVIEHYIVQINKNEDDALRKFLKT